MTALRASSTAQSRTRDTLPMPRDGLVRTHIENVQPQVDGGRYASKRVMGDAVVVEADIFADGHDVLDAIVLFRKRGERDWQSVRMAHIVNDRWRAQFVADAIGPWEFTVRAWVDHFATWARDLRKREAAGQDLSVEFLVGADLVREAQRGAEKSVLDRLRRYEQELRSDTLDTRSRFEAATSDSLADLMFEHGPRDHAEKYAVLPLSVDREKARFSAWYEMFPRSYGDAPGKHGTFRSAQRRLSYIADMGFDVLYLPPIHPIGKVNRKGRNNKVSAEPGDVGSPWAIGSDEGGHDAIHPDLGTHKDFRDFCRAAAKHGLEIALDIAFQCAPDHPWVQQHPEWFRRLPDGTIRYAENPPKKYQDIYPINFETPDWQNLWRALRDVILHWVGEGVKIFRVDNPHTKSFRFWEWCIADIRREHPEVLFLSEAFTRPKVMYSLAKLGFSQSYTYYAWKNTKAEIVEYFTELTAPPVVDFFRPNVWPNTPDILNEFLQEGGRAASALRLILAGTLCSNYGIYGPVFELAEVAPREPGSEEYLDSEKYQLRAWDGHKAESSSLAPLIRRVNQIRREHPALQRNDRLRFHTIDNDRLVCFSKSPPPGEAGDTILCVVNLDPSLPQSGWTDLDMPALGLEWFDGFEVEDLLTGAMYGWQGQRNFVMLHPGADQFAHIFRLTRPSA